MNTSWHTFVAGGLSKENQSTQNSCPQNSQHKNFQIYSTKEAYHTVHVHTFPNAKENTKPQASGGQVTTITVTHWYPWSWSCHQHWAWVGPLVQHDTQSYNTPASAYKKRNGNSELFTQDWWREAFLWLFTLILYMYIHTISIFVLKLTKEPTIFFLQ